jgi:hypothetical protein
MPSASRLGRLREEIAEEVGALDGVLADDAVLREVDYALRPTVHERRVHSFGALVDPAGETAQWEAATGLRITHRLDAPVPRAAARLFADGLTTWAVPRDADTYELLVLDRPTSSERDLVVLAAATGSTIVQRHPSGVVRIVGAHGVLRWDALRWHHEPPVSTWMAELRQCPGDDEGHVLAQLLAFAVHDLGARGIGAILLHRPGELTGPALEQRLPTPPPLRIVEPTDLAPLRHALAQVDGAAVFDVDGTLVQLGVRLVPTAEAEGTVDGLRGMRHTSGRRYSYDDPLATVIVVSEDGPVTVLRAGSMLGRTE